VAERRASAFLRGSLEEWAPGFYEQVPLGDWDLYSAPQPSGGWERLSARPWRVSANKNAGEARRAVDGKTETRWTSGAPQSPGLFFQVDLGRPERISRIRLLLGDSPRDFPRQLKVLFSLDGKNWREAVPLNRPLYWDGERLFREARVGETDLRFPELEARHLALQQTGRDPRYYWSIHELEIYSPGKNR
jgi:hypothetical protein